MRTRKSCIVLIGVCLLAITLVGCGNSGKKEQAERMLSKRYGEEFRVVSCEGTQIWDGYYTVFAVPEEHPDMVIEASIDTDGSGFSDNYAGKCVAEKISDRVTENLNGIKGNVFVHSELMVDMLPAEYAKMSAEEYQYEDKGNRVTISVFVAPETLSEADLQMPLVGIFRGLQLNGVMDLYIVSQNTLEKIQEYCRKNIKLYGDFNDDFYQYKVYSGVPFENGILRFEEQYR